MAVKPLTLRAVNPNPGIRARYRRSLRAMIVAMKEDYARRLSALYNVLEPRIVGDAKWKTPMERMQDELGKLASKWEGKFTSFASKIAPSIVKSVFGRVAKSRRQSIKDVGFDVPLKDKDLKGRISDARVQVLIEANVALIKTIPQDCHARVLKMVTNAVANGQTEKELTAEIFRVFAVSERRANVIARDQTLKATQSLAQAVDKELGITEGVWIHVPGRKMSRPTHVAMNGKKFTLTTGLWDSDEHKWVRPGECILCACKYRPIVPETWKAGTYRQTVFE